MLCHKCGGSGNLFKPKRGSKFKDKFRICCACHGTGNLKADHAIVVAVKQQREIMDRS